ncbi:competence protein CoiA [Aquimarina macrocephali]|uniref:competence protein CoiA n=1 Tax=Aquimarina macrocephali TaxID=666563 RepID=UPI003F669A9B
MIWAIVKNEKKEAIPNTEGICPFCNEKVFSKCGDINVWHWAHSKKENCDSWYEPETNWHFHWKMSFGKENTEKIITKEGKKHIADIKTKKGIVIELQNSPIKKYTIKERENFYGEQMLWLINGEKLKNNLTPKRYWDDKRYEEFIDNTEELVRLIMGPKITKEKNGEFFKWKNPRKSWKDVERPVFIDFTGNSLFMIKEGMGTSQIRGIYYSKETFIKYYGGDYDYYSKHF